jgi:hypothetical protein
MSILTKKIANESNNEFERNSSYLMRNLRRVYKKRMFQMNQIERVVEQAIGGESDQGKEVVDEFGLTKEERIGMLKKLKSFEKKNKKKKNTNEVGDIILDDILNNDRNNFNQKIIFKKSKIIYKKIKLE